ncbi:tyrosine-type recombinase/integrase [Parabacteroides sp.]
MKEKDLTSYMQSVIGCLEKDRKRPAAHTYRYALKSFMKFSGGEDMPVDKVFMPGRLKEYEEWMKRDGKSLNTISTYMRTLKAVYNRLVAEKVLPYEAKLFDGIYTKVEQQTKRALTKEQTGVLLHADFRQLPQKERRALAYFLLMLLLRGMPFIDLAHLRRQDIKGNYLVYCRHKTGRQLTVHIPREAAWLLEEFRNDNPDSVYLLPILDGKQKDKGEPYACYLHALRNFNKDLVKMAAVLLPGVKISSYTARHTWATLAFYQGMSVGIISKALGHSSIKVTETYLKPFENEKVDAANDALIAALQVA